MSVFDRLQRQDTRNETRILWSEVGIVIVTTLLVTVYLMIL
ncbi:hypothetical protein [Reyranella sp.]